MSIRSLALSCTALFALLAVAEPIPPQDGSYYPPEVPDPDPTEPAPEGGSGVKFQPDGASPGFYCEYPSLTDWKSCNSAESRDCWLQKDSEKLDIHTDYENPANTPPGITREYWIELDGDVLLTADGFQKTTGKVFNKTFPAPLLEACWGDEVVVHVRNNYDQNGTTVHWHGIRQLNTPQMDGANGVTQCPIAKGDYFTYRWRAHQYGPTWYHSHYALQYSDGALGPLTIYGPHSDDWDINLGSILVQDYVHPTAFIAFQQEKTSNNFARTDSIVVNGLGHDPLTGTGSYFETKLTPGKKHLIRLINSSAGTTFVVTFDNHPMTVVGSDFVAIEPYTTNSLVIGIGQRYAVIIEANQDPASYWIRTHPATSCNGFVEALGNCGLNGRAGVFDDNCTLFDVRTAILSYDSADIPDGTLPASEAFPYGLGCFDEPAEKLHPIVPWTIDAQPVNDITHNNFTVGRQNAGLPADQLEPGGYQHWLLTPDFFWIDFGQPTILNASSQTEWDNNYHVVDEPYNSGYIFMIFESNIMSPAPGNITTNIPISHPMHWHGHDVALLAQNQSAFDPSSSFASFNFDNPPRRDVILLPENGYIAIAMRADNPGPWLIHCHIAWHASAGLAMQILESQSTFLDSIGGSAALDETNRVCENWRAYNAQNPILQDESGI